MMQKKLTEKVVFFFFSSCFPIPSPTAWNPFHLLTLRSVQYLLNYELDISCWCFFMNDDNFAHIIPNISLSEYVEHYVIILKLLWIRFKILMVCLNLSSYFSWNFLKFLCNFNFPSSCLIFYCLHFMLQT